MLLTLAGGAGLAAYVFLWALTPEGDATATHSQDTGPTPPRSVASGASCSSSAGLFVVGGAVLLTPVLGGGVIGSVLVPLFTIAIGAIVAWSNLDDAQRSRWSGPVRAGTAGCGWRWAQA